MLPCTPTQPCSWLCQHLFNFWTDVYNSEHDVHKFDPSIHMKYFAVLPLIIRHDT